MKFINQRLFNTEANKSGDYTLGHFHAEDGSFNSFVLEDDYEAVKIKGATRIPGGPPTQGLIYELKIRKELTPLTIKHRNDYKESPWFKANPNWFHIEVTGIKDYSGVYIHAGVDDSHTLGCPLLCYGFDLSKSDRPGFNSLLAVDAFYSMTYPLLESGKKCWLEVRDEIKN